MTQVRSAGILIVEDEPIIAMALQMVLEDVGYEVVGIARSGAKAVEMAQSTRPAAVVMDVRLPGGMDGIAAAEGVRQACDPKVVFVTGSAEPEVKDRIAAFAPDETLIKPVKPDILVDVLRRLDIQPRAGLPQG